VNYIIYFIVGFNILTILCCFYVTWLFEQNDDQVIKLAEKSNTTKRDVIITANQHAFSLTMVLLYTLLLQGDF